MMDFAPAIVGFINRLVNVERNFPMVVLRPESSLSLAFSLNSCLTLVSRPPKVSTSKLSQQLMLASPEEKRQKHQCDEITWLDRQHAVCCQSHPA